MFHSLLNFCDLSAARPYEQQEPEPEPDEVKPDKSPEKDPVSPQGVILPPPTGK